MQRAIPVAVNISAASLRDTVSCSVSSDRQLSAETAIEHLVVSSVLAGTRPLLVGVFSVCHVYLVRDTLRAYLTSVHMSNLLK